MRQSLTSPAQVGQVLVGRRQTLKLSQHALAAKLGISQNRLSELEANPSRLTLDRFLALANLLGLELVVQIKSPTTSTSEW